MRLKNLIPLALLLATPFAQAIDIQRWHNAHGTQILLVERHELPIVDYAVIFKGAGSTAEPNGKSDIAQPTASMLTRGTQKLDEETFAARINDLGSSISGSSSYEYSLFSFRSLSDRSKLAATADLLNHARKTAPCSPCAKRKATPAISPAANKPNSTTPPTPTAKPPTAANKASAP